MSSLNFSSAVTLVMLSIGMQSDAFAEDSSPQPLNGIGKPFTFIVKAPGKTQSQLYSISREWFTNSYQNVGGV